MNIHTTDTVFNSGMQFTSTIGSHKIIMDAVPADGGKDSGASPKKLMLAALAGCTGMDIVMILNKMKVPFSGFSMRVEAELTETDPKFYNKVKLIYTIRLAEQDKVKMERAVLLSHDKYCGVAAMFRAFAEVKRSVHYL